MFSSDVCRLSNRNMIAKRISSPTTQDVDGFQHSLIDRTKRTRSEAAVNHWLGLAVSKFRSSGILGRGV